MHYLIAVGFVSGGREFSSGYFNSRTNQNVINAVFVGLTRQIRIIRRTNSAQINACLIMRNFPNVLLIKKGEKNGL